MLYSPLWEKFTDIRHKYLLMYGRDSYEEIEKAGIGSRVVVWDKILEKFWTGAVSGFQCFKFTDYYIVVHVPDRAFNVAIYKNDYIKLLK